MNASAKITACRVAFMLLVVLPTFAVLSYVSCEIWRPIELTPSAWSSLLSEKTGLEIRIAKMHRDGAGVFVLEQFEVGDPESDKIWISSPQVEATLSGNTLRLNAAEISIAASGIVQLSEHLQHRILMSRKESFQPFHLQASKGNVIRSAPDLSSPFISNLEISAIWNEAGPTLNVNVELIDDLAPVWVSLVANRNRENSQPITHFDCKIEGEAGISANLLAEFAPEWNSLGPYARFCGQMEGEPSKFVLSGIDLREVDLAKLGQRWGVAGISGFASIGGKRQGDVSPGARVEFRNGKFTDFFGELSIQNGSLDGRLLARLARALPLEADPECDFSKYQQIDFANCALRIELRGENLRISGLLKQNGVIAIQEGVIAWLSAPILRNARDIVRTVLSEVHSDELPTSRWVAAMPSSRSAAAASTANARKDKNSR